MTDEELKREFGSLEEKIKDSIQANCALTFFLVVVFVCIFVYLLLGK